MGVEKSKRPILEPGKAISLEERRTGKLWIDGEPIFTKAVDTGALPVSSSKTVAHGITNIGNVIGMLGAAKDPTGPEWTSMPNSNVRLQIDETNIEVFAGGDQSAFTESVTIVEYTKV